MRMPADSIRLKRHRKCIKFGLLFKILPLTFVITTSIFAQESFAPPKIIEITTVEGGERMAEAFVSALQRRAKANGQHWIGGRFMSGSPDRICLISFHQTYAQTAGWYRAVFQTNAGVVHLDKSVNVHTTILSLNESISYNEARIPWRAAKAFGLNVMFLKRGGTDSFLAEQKLAADLLKRAKINDEEFIGYGVVYGETVPAFLFLTPMWSLSDLDKDLTAQHETLFTPEQDRHRSETLRETVQAGSDDLMIVDPHYSNR